MATRRAGGRTPIDDLRKRVPKGASLPVGLDALLAARVMLRAASSASRATSRFRSSLLKRIASRVNPKSIDGVDAPHGHKPFCAAAIDP